MFVSNITQLIINRNQAEDSSINTTMSEELHARAWPIDVLLLTGYVLLVTRSLFVSFLCRVVCGADSLPVVVTDFVLHTRDVCCCMHLLVTYFSVGRIAGASLKFCCCVGDGLLLVVVVVG